MQITGHIVRLTLAATGVGAGLMLTSGIVVAQADTGTSGTSQQSHTKAKAAHRPHGPTTAPRTPRPVASAAASQSAAASTNDVATTSATSAKAISSAPIPPTFDQIIQYTFFNKAPTVNPVQQSVDPETRIVKGDLRAAGGPTLTYTLSTAPQKGAVQIESDGTYTFTPNEQLAAGGTDQFTVIVDNSSNVKLDGILGTLQAVLHSLAQAIGLSQPDTTVAVVNVSIGTSGPPPDPDGLSTFCGCTLMPQDTIFHADIRNLSVTSESDTWLNILGAERGATLRAAWGGTPWQGSVGGMPVNTVSATHPTEMVIFNRGYSTTGPGIDNTPYAIPDYPLVEGMPDIPAWDRHLLVFQEGTCISQELYNVANGVELPANSVLDALGNAAYAALYGSSWIAEAGVHYDMSSPLYPAIGTSNASQLPYLPMILRPDEFENGHIDHMLGIVIAKDHGTGYAWPARSGDGTGTNPDGVPMGSVFRLRADFDMTGYAPSTQVILRALQTHGAVVYDSMGAGEDGAGLLVMSNGWEGIDYTTARNQLNTIPIGAFEAVDVSLMAVDPTTSWQTTTI